jgi:hypothetical protein
MFKVELYGRVRCAVRIEGRSGRDVLVKGYVHSVAICYGSEVIARHPRSYEREELIFDPLHYLALLEQKTHALNQAAPLAGWQLTDCFTQLQRMLEARLNKHGCGQLRCGEASAAVPDRTKTATSGSGERSSPADGSGPHHTGRRCHRSLQSVSNEMGAVLANVIGNAPAKESFENGDYIATSFRRQAAVPVLRG